MPIFKREQDPPYHQAAVARASTQAATQALHRGDRLTTPATAAAAIASPAANDPEAARAAAQPSTEPPSARPPAAVVDERTEITGTLKSSGNALIEGRFHGEVEAKETVWIEHGAQSDGQLRANDAVVAGSVDGEIDCQNRLQIRASAVVSGQIKTPILVIEDGATVNCRFSMMREGVMR